MDFLKWLFSFLPEDQEEGAGWGWFKLPAGHPFHRIAKIHDYRFAHASEQRLCEADWELLNGMFYLVRAEKDPMKRCKLAMDMCKYWMIARIVGRYLYGRNLDKPDEIAVKDQITKVRVLIENAEIESKTAENIMREQPDAKT